MNDGQWITEEQYSIPHRQKIKQLQQPTGRKAYKVRWYVNEMTLKWKRRWGDT